MCRLDGPIGRACLAPESNTPMITSVDNAILKPALTVDARFVVYVLCATPYLEWVQSVCRVGGGHRFRISRSMLGDFRVPAPPVAEQRGIADVLDHAAEAILAIERRIARQVEYLLEYRQALISAVVTGQIDVSGEAA